MSDPILGKRTLDKYLKNYKWDESKLKSAQKTFKRWADALDTDWANTKETELTSPFYDQIMLSILGYTEGPANNYTIGYENRTKTSGQKPDVVLGNFSSSDHSQPLGLIEFESPYTPLDSHNKGVEQAFKYQSQYKNPVRWIIASNFRETRIYDKTRENVECFNVRELANDPYQLKKFIFFLGVHSIVKQGNRPTNLETAVANNVADQKAISNKFYDDYLKTRKKLIDNIQNNNPQVDTGHAFTYAQKILDRFIFIAFTQDYDLIPPKTFESVINVHEAGFNRYPIWTQMKSLFNAIDQGWPEKHINHFNGGLFRPDPAIDELGITDDVFKYFKIIDDYDFKSDLSINLLGHIFEQAINDIDAAKNGNTNSAKRKQDGIFYTPSSITSYLLNEALQSWLNDAYQELGLTDDPTFNDKDYEEYRKFYINPNNRKHPNKRAKAVSNYVAKLEELKDKIKSLKLVDPAVGSGSFLTQALSSLKALLNQVQNTIDAITLQPTIPTPDTEILSNNLFGVDINAESVEIAKLSLWLRTANKERPLTTLDTNLKVGNSVINEPKVVSNAFVWGQEFKQVFKQHGGFDIVLGNPPYVTSSESMSNEEKEYYKNNYSMSEYQENLYRVFTEKGFNLLKPGGWFSFIVPKTWFNNIYFGKMREFLRNKTNNLKIIDVKDQVFPDANVDTSLIIFKKPTNGQDKNSSITVGQWSHNQILFEQKQTLPKNRAEPIVIEKTNDKLDQIINKVTNHCSKDLSNYLTITDGIKLFERGKGTPTQPTNKEDFQKFKKNSHFFSPYKLNKTYYPFYEGKKLHRYYLEDNDKYLNYGPQLAAPRKLRNFSGKHIFIRRIPNHGKYVVTASLVDKGIHLHEQAIWDGQPNDPSINLETLLGIINSSTISFWLIMKMGILSRQTFPQLRKTFIETLPVPNLSTQRNNIISGYVNNVLKLEREKWEIVQNYYTTIQIFDSKPLSFSQVIGNSSTLKKHLQKKVAINKVAKIINYIEDSTQAYIEKCHAIAQYNKKIDDQVYKAFDFTGKDILSIEDVLNHITDKQHKR